MAEQVIERSWNLNAIFISWQDKLDVLANLKKLVLSVMRIYLFTFFGNIWCIHQVSSQFGWQVVRQQLCIHFEPYLTAIYIYNIPLPKGDWVGECTPPPLSDAPHPAHRE